MAHIHAVKDSDTHFSINPITRQIKNESSRKTTLIQFDHNSERFTFEIPRYVENHDMSVCNKTEIHYINIDQKTKQEKRGTYPVDDLHVKADDQNTVVCSWLISNHATQLVGKLSFVVRYCCVENDRLLYAWNSAIATVDVSSGIDSGDYIVSEYADVLEKWKAELFNAGYINAATMQREISVLSARMDNFAKLPNGSTAGDAELRDIRIGADGKSYESAGAAVRAQFNDKFRVSSENYNFDWLTKHKTPVAYNYVFYPDGTFVASEDVAMFCAPVEENTRYRFTNANGNGGAAKTAMQRLAFLRNPFVSAESPVSLIGEIIYHTEDIFTTPKGCRYILFVVGKSHYLVTGAYETSIQKITDEHPDPTYPTTDKRFNYELSDSVAIPYVDNSLSNVEKRLGALEYSPEDEVIAWGDSLTYGAGSGDASLYSYTARLAQLTGMKIVNYGVGGETVETIAGRQGGLPMIVSPGFVIPSGAVPVEISIKSITGADSKPLLQSANAEKGINPCIVAGITGTLTQSDGKYYFTRSEIGDSVAVDRPSMLITKAMAERKRNQILLLWVGQNNAGEVSEDGARTFAQKLSSALRSCINYIGTEKYLILSAPIDGNYAQYSDIFEKMVTEFGGHFVNVFEYLLDYGLEDSNIAATDTDTENLVSKRIPQSLRHDGVHLNAAGYNSVAKCVYRRGKELGYWN